MTDSIVRPLGVEPEWSFLENRYNDLSDAMSRYDDVDLLDDPIVDDWNNEMQRIQLYQLKSGRIRKLSKDKRFIFERCVSGGG